MSQLNPEHLKSVIEIINKGPFFKHMSMTVTELGVGYSMVVADIGRQHMNPFGALHGGVYSSVIDTAAYYGRGMSEMLLGKVLPDIPRDSYYLGTKLGRFAPQHFDFSPRRVEERGEPLLGGPVEEPESRGREELPE